MILYYIISYYIILYYLLYYITIHRHIYIYIYIYIVRHILTVSIPILAAPRCFRWSQFSANVVLICRFFEPRKKRKHLLHYSGYLFKVRNGCVMVWKWGIPPIWRCFKIYSHRERDEEAVDLRTVVAKVFTPGAEAGPS